MKIVTHRFCHTATLAFLVSMSAMIAGCRPCPFGQEIVIPASDATDPSIVMDFHLPNGSIVTVTPTSTPSTIKVPGGGQVTVLVKAIDSEGVQDAQIWAASIKYTIDPSTGTTSTSGPGLLSTPTASNRDGSSPGQKGCTERVVSQNLEVRKTSRGGIGYEVHAEGLNFGGRVISTPLITLQAQ
jgi:hypothetical protein